MPTKLTLYAKNIAVATSVLEHALAEGCAVAEVIETDPPINGKRKQASQRGKKRGGPYKLLMDGEPTGLRGDAYAFFKVAKLTEGKPIDFVNALIEEGWEKGQARSAVAGLQKSQVLLRSN